jgi:hypothetical protein
MCYTYVTHTGRVAVDCLCNQCEYQMDENVCHCTLSMGKKSFPHLKHFCSTFFLHLKF